MGEHISLYIKDEEIIDALRLAKRYGEEVSPLIMSVLDKDELLERVGKLSNHITEDEERFNDIVFIYQQVKEQFYEDYKRYRENVGDEYSHGSVEALSFVEEVAEKLHRAPKTLLKEFEEKYEEEV